MVTNIVHGGREKIKQSIFKLLCSTATRVKACDTVVSTFKEPNFIIADNTSV